ncbi:hypothetical protein ERICIV_01194 [Paenibacillus larvae subsp. larvae]|uniref:Uncharacterized protein n=1 Tax=Paenibacillus larvae subsp. larvae TaxID=147375 RepID=A0A2L1TXG7_9BACL|nr:hypothetical protein [Paenibacillus larvae]AQT85931.1 hypothetical protein B1222_18320 [Paenibacillus larvae subsp. pulvifaciens]AQZ45830.1 hypothetical protein B5S25_03675 [Paenibacillus larvae subsp. pulvifaciens]AVF25375.1 hypothetical protein ERICIII_01173 [Paenibacillus larvae subsp. larvae]AVF30152.1 hypothetical protein ERICIV_01194 [Paenibacillus larvae subsp. larvae]MCY7522188.1 hypothetical protein [Paenibacillus larvae]
MAQVTHAEFVRMSQRNDVPCGEVKFYLDGEDTPYLAEVISSADGHKEVRRVYKMQADPAVDWYDNNMHQAYEEVTNRFADRAPSDLSSQTDSPDASAQAASAGATMNDLTQQLMQVDEVSRGLEQGFSAPAESNLER